MTNVSASAGSLSVTAPLPRGGNGCLPQNQAQNQAIAVPRAVRHQSNGFSLRTVAALFILLLAITAIPVVLHPWPPMSDYINHLARMQVIATIGTDPDLARF
jgi:hypothetical protein